MRNRRTTFRKRSRAALGWALGLFAAGQLAAGLILDYAAPLTRFPSAGRVAKYLEQEPKPPEVVFFGSSRTGGGIQAAEMNSLLAGEFPADPPRVLNAAAPGGDPITAEYMLDMLVSRGVRPKVVVLEVWPEAFNRRNPFVNLHVVRQFNWEDAPTSYMDIVRSRSAWLYLQARLVPVYTHRKQILLDTRREALAAGPHRPKNNPTTTARPLDAGPLDWDKIIRNAPAGTDGRATSERQLPVEVRKWLTPYVMTGSGMAALERVLERCRRDGVSVILATYPTCTIHRDEYTPVINSQFIGYMDHLCAEYGCRFVDGREWVPDALFRDLLHVIPDGGKMYTRRFAGEALIPVLKARP
jgi:hypothetical protein